MINTEIENLNEESTMLNEEHFFPWPFATPWFSKSTNLVTIWSRFSDRIVRVLLYIDPSSTPQYANLTLETPTEKVLINDYHIPIPLRLVSFRRESMTPIRSFSSFGSSLFEETNTCKTMCTVESHTINSLDEVIYRTRLIFLANDIFSTDILTLPNSEERDQTSSNPLQPLQPLH